MRQHRWEESVPKSVPAQTALQKGHIFEETRNSLYMQVAQQLLLDQNGLDWFDDSPEHNVGLYIGVGIEQVGKHSIGKRRRQHIRQLHKERFFSVFDLKTLQTQKFDSIKLKSAEVRATACDSISIFEKNSISKAKFRFACFTKSLGETSAKNANIFRPTKFLFPLPRSSTNKFL